MTLTSALLLLALLATVAGTGVAAARYRSVRLRLAAHEGTLLGVMARLAERGRVLANRQELEAAQRAAEGAVGVSAEGVRATHAAIAEIPFGILGQIPATRDTARAARRVHDTTANGIYDAIAFVNKLTGEGLRRRIHREQRGDRTPEE